MYKPGLTIKVHVKARSAVITNMASVSHLVTLASLEVPEDLTHLCFRGSAGIWMCLGRH